MPEERFEERTEDPTPRRREEARERGHVARSHDLSSAVILLAAVIALNFFGKELIGTLMAVTANTFGDIATADLDRNNIYVYLLTY
ncbi:EscU/YscU/HrcU family type III secretion system export apparatus switch protein, partial [Candidatus Peregrinibacteria bacterium]|nr:EscU/YscU/HrcU family type III secretion system export apparatus switch protein [Candidatus Peregrinibacteria bacterium]